jgi:hypothetical protein
MVNQTPLDEVVKIAVESLPAELTQKLVWVVQAIGGLFLIYLILLGFKLYFTRKQTKMVYEIKEDIDLIKEKLGIKEKNKEKEISKKKN